MACKINSKDNSATLDLIVGCHRITLVDQDTLQVEALSSKGEWMECQFPPWSFIIKELTAYLEPRLEVIDLGWELSSKLAEGLTDSQQ